MCIRDSQNVVDVTFPRMSSQVDAFAKEAAASFGLSETMAKRFTGTFGAIDVSKRQVCIIPVAETVTQPTFRGSPQRMIPGRGKNWKALRKKTSVKGGCSMLPDRPESMPDWRNFLWIRKTGKNTHEEQENGTRRPRRGSGVMKNCQII